MNFKDQIIGIGGGYEPKFRILRFLRRHLTGAVVKSLTVEFDSLWDVDGDRYFPRMTEFPSKARRLLHPKERDHEVWDEARRLNVEILNVPVSKIHKKAAECSAAKKAQSIAGVWNRIGAIAQEENNFIDRHIETMLHLVSQCPGRWLERENFEGFRRFAADVYGFLDLLEEDVKLIRRLNSDIDLLTCDRLQVHIIGIGEITTTIEILGGKDRGLKDPKTGRRFHYAVKKLPPFPSVEDAKLYGALFDKYQEILRDKAGIKLPVWGWFVKPMNDGRALVYAYQERLPQHSNLAIIIKKAGVGECRKLFSLMMKNAKRVFDYNRADNGIQLGFDAQLPNWCVTGFDPDRSSIRGDEEFKYIDTSTPMMRKAGGADMLDTEIFLKIVPAPFRPIVRGSIIKEVLDRYYRPRDVIMDQIASFYLYLRPDMVPILVADANEYFKTEMADYDLKPFTVKEMAAYHRQDTMIWVFFRAIKRLDRFIKENFFGKPYEQRLPKKRFRPGPYGE